MIGIPGFTGDITDYKTRTTYHTAGARAVITGKVVPQQQGKDPSDPCRGACKCCAHSPFEYYGGCCARCDSCLPGVAGVGGAETLLKA